MGKETTFSVTEYIKILESLSGMEVLNCYHTQDSVLRFSLLGEGKKVTLILDGNWQLFNQKRRKICDSSQDLKITDHEYYEKLRRCADTLSNEVSYLSSISFNENAKEATMKFNNNWYLKTQENKFGLLSFQDENTAMYVISTVDENTGKANYFSATP